MQKKFVEYVCGQLHSEQWAFFLEAISQELLQLLSLQDVRSLARKAGMRAGRALWSPECDSLEEMEQTANAHWSRLEWGFVGFEEQSGYLLIKHHLSPLKATMGNDAIGWSAGFLEGVYQEWFLLLGASSELQVTQVGEADESGGLIFRLGR